MVREDILTDHVSYQQFGGYITDITRTWPIRGKFSQPQKDLYMAVLSAQRTCISLCRASSNLSLDKLHEIAESAMKDQLSQLGFDVTGNVRCFLHSLFIKLSLKLSKLIELLITGDRNPFSASPESLHWSRRARYGRAFPQDTTSGGAMRDCRAVGFYLNSLTKNQQTSRPLRCTFLLVNEMQFGWLLPLPHRGLYVPDQPCYPVHFRGLNVRIEDSVCVQDENAYVLTTEAVKEVSFSFPATACKFVRACAG